MESFAFIPTVIQEQPVSTLMLLTYTSFNNSIFNLYTYCLTNNPAIANNAKNRNTTLFAFVLFIYGIIKAIIIYEKNITGRNHIGPTSNFLNLYSIIYQYNIRIILYSKKGRMRFANFFLMYCLLIMFFPQFLLIIHPPRKKNSGM